MHKIAIQFHFIESYINIFFFDYVQFEILVSSKVLTLIHLLGQPDEEIVKLGLGEVEKVGGLVDAIEKIFVDLQKLLLWGW